MKYPPSEEFEKDYKGRRTMSRQLNKEDCDLILQGAVVLACGGGGPLHFARLILDELYEEDYASVETPNHVGNEDWMTMIALVGTPSKVHNVKRHISRKREKAPTRTSPWASPRPSPRSSPRSSPTRVDGGSRYSSLSSLCSSREDLLSDSGSSPKRSFYEIVKRVMRVKFLCTAVGAGFGDAEQNGLDETDMEPILPRTPNNAARNTFLYLQQQCALRAMDNVNYNRFDGFTQFSYILTGELGAVNMATALYLSAINNISVVDCDGAGRSVPLVNQITYADRFSVSPTCIMSPQPGPDFQSIASTLLDFPCGTEKMVEEVAAALISDANGPFHPYIGYGTYVIKGEQMGDVPVFGSYSIALEVGKAINTFQGYERAEQVSEILTSHGRPNKVVFHGTITDKVLQSSGAKDTGYMVVTDFYNPQDKLLMWYKNEVILAGRPGESPEYMAPDSICILPAIEGPMDISTIPEPHMADHPLEVYILVIEADDKIRSHKVIKSFESIYKLFQMDSKCVYNGGYKMWSKSLDEAKKEAPKVDKECLSQTVITVQAATPQFFESSKFF